MTFKTLNPKIMKSYQDAYIEKKKQEVVLFDAAAHRNGVYAMYAIGAAFSKSVKYPQEPFSIKEEKQKKLEEMSEEEYYEAMRNAIRGMNKQFEREEAE